MSTQPNVSRPVWTLPPCFLAVGLLFAVFGGLDVTSSGYPGGKAPLNNFVAMSRQQVVGGDIGPYPVDVIVQRGFVWWKGVLGFLFGAALGWLVGLLWDRRGLGRAVSFVLVVLVGGMAGVACAVQFGGETRIVTSARAMNVEVGASLVVIVGGGILGMATAVLGAWRFSRPPRANHRGGPEPLGFY